ncbi:MAG: DUF6787 family protein [Nonlabens sp.]
MQKLKDRWDITKNWQLIYILLGIAVVIACGLFIANKITGFFTENSYYYLILVLLTIVLSYTIYKLTLWLFVKLRPKWKVQHRWELIAIFIVFAITGSASARLSGPFLEWFNIDLDHLSPWVFWPIRLLIIFPVYQVLLVLIGWIFGQFNFFWAFEKKMLRRFGINL